MANHRFQIGTGGTAGTDTSLAGRRGAGRLVVPGIIGLALLLAIGYSLLVSDRNDNTTGDAVVRVATSAQELPQDH